ncbi:FG-GAP-like repeat-containing protein [Cohnella soli]|uniref:FG-GAP-like repeat-containing protein n=1 Tax=Cohnella soli TaxID=425005 RepID=A0ABW0HW53_9BACL
MYSRRRKRAISIRLVLLGIALFVAMPLNAMGATLLQEAGPIGNTANPNAFAYADFNEDGNLDAAIAGVIGDVHILLGDGAGNFADTGTTYAVGAMGSSPTAMIAADLNGDGHADIATADFGTNQVSILIGDGHGAFAPSVDYAVNDSPASIAAGDFNADGTTDLAVTLYSNGKIAVLLGDAMNGQPTGTFAPATEIDVGTGVSYVIAGAFDQQAGLDLVVAYASARKISVLSGRNDGTFAAPVDYSYGNASPPSRAPLLTTGQFNGDAYPDIAITDTVAKTVYIMLGSAGGAFVAGSTVPTTESPISIAQGDFNGDGHADLAMGRLETDDVLVALGNGNGQFAGATAFNYATGISPVRLAAADFTNDQKTDLIAVDPGDVVVPGGVRLLIGNGNGSFRSPLTFATDTGPTLVNVGDFNNDSYFDLAIPSSAGQLSGVTIMLGAADGTFNKTSSFPLPNYSSIKAMELGDFNDDGKVDIAIAASSQSSQGFVSILYGNGNGAFPKRYDVDVGTAPVSLDAGDFDSDFVTDLAIALYGDNAVTILLGTKNGDPVPTTVATPVGTHPKAIAALDFNGDSYADIAVTTDITTLNNASTGNVDTTSNIFILLNKGAANSPGDVQFNVAGVNGVTAVGMPTDILASYIDGDNFADLVVADENLGNIELFSGNGDGTFTSVVSYSTPSPSKLALGKLDSDSFVDLAVISQSAGTMTILNGIDNNGTIQFDYQHPEVHASIAGADAITVGPFNADSIMDAAVVNYIANEVTVYYSGAFVPTVGQPPAVNPGGGGDGGNSNPVVTTPTEQPSKEEPPKEEPPKNPFSDLDGHWALAYILDAVKQGIVNGYPDGTFRPNRPITRAEFTVMLMQAIQAQGEGETAAFTDNGDIGTWAAKAISLAVAKDIVHGYADGKFRPDRPITRAEMAVMVAAAFGIQLQSGGGAAFKDDAAIPAWAKDAVSELWSRSIVNGRGAGLFAPSGQSTRAEAVAIILRAQKNRNAQK